MDRSRKKYRSGNYQIRRVRDIDWKRVQPKRAGVIVYDYSSGDLEICLGVDASTGQLTDFGGGVSYQIDQTALRGALREFSEETHDVFGEINNPVLQDSYVVYNEVDILIILYPCLIGNALENFQSSRNIRSENSALVRLNRSQIQSLLDGQTIISEAGRRSRSLYAPVHSLLSSTRVLDLL